MPIEDTEGMISRIRPRLESSRNRALKMIAVEYPCGPNEGEAEELMLVFLAGAVACLGHLPGGEYGNAKLLNVAQGMTVLYGEFPVKEV